MTRWSFPILVVLAVLLAPAAARAQQPPGPDGNGSDFFVTIAARQCPDYADIRANLARNNIQESLKDLGLNSPYTAGQQVTPTIEAETQPKCTQITNWQFVLGTGIAGAPVVGTWGSLSVVSAPFATDITTLGEVPGRDDQGRIITGTAIPGATTIELTSAQAKLAETSSRLWLQGGTPTDPVLAKVPEFTDVYGFGALRCAIDNLNGDNVEWIKFPAGVRHVYCFAYYVTPPPTSGTIIVRKRVTDPPNATQAFRFEGNVSYTPDHTFTLAVANGSVPSATFYRSATRAGDPPWTVRELVPSGWQLSGLTCTAQGSTVLTDAATATVTISRLQAADTVDCLFSDALRPTDGTLLLRKLTIGGVGSFPFTIDPAAGGETTRAKATTVTEGVAVDAVPGPIVLAPGTYRIAEDLPASAEGGWRQVAVNCNARRRRSAGPVDVTVSASQGVVCTFENAFTPAGSIAVFKATHGGTGTAGFVISSVEEPSRQYVQEATTRAEDEFVRGTGDSTLHLPLGRYVIQESVTISDPPGRWVPVAVDCGGRLRAFEQGRVVVELTRAHPDVACRFENTRVGVGLLPPPTVMPTPTPAPLPAPTPPAPAPLPEPALADLVVTKRALRSEVRVGAPARFKITVRNAGPAAAEQVVLADGLVGGGQLEAAHPSQGTCLARRIITCRLGLIAAGEQVTVLVRARATAPGTIRNLAVAGSSTDEVQLDNNAGGARVLVSVVQGAFDPCARASVARLAC